MAAIEARSLVREFKKGPRAVDGIDLTVAGEAGPVGTAWLTILVGGVVLGAWSLWGLRTAERG